MTDNVPQRKIGVYGGGHLDRSYNVHTEAGRYEGLGLGDVVGVAHMFHPTRIKFSSNVRPEVQEQLRRRVLT